MGVRRLTDAEIFLEVKRSLNPLVFDRIPLRRPESSLQRRSTREQIVNTNIEHEEETYIRIGGLLYSFITLKRIYRMPLFRGSCAILLASTFQLRSTRTS